MPGLLIGPSWFWMESNHVDVLWHHKLWNCGNSVGKIQYLQSVLTECNGCSWHHMHVTYAITSYRMKTCKPHTLDLFWLHFVTIVPSMFFASCGQLIHFLPLWWAFQNYKIPSLWLLTTFIMFVKVIPSLQLIIGCGHCKEHAWRCDVWCDWCDRCQVALYEMHQTLWSPTVQVFKKSERFPRRIP